MFANALDRAEDFAFRALGFDSPEDQIVAAVVIGAVLIATSAVGLIGTLLLLPIPMALAGIGILRLVPMIDSLWPLS